MASLMKRLCRHTPAGLRFMTRWGVTVPLLVLQLLTWLLLVEDLKGLYTAPKTAAKEVETLYPDNKNIYILDAAAGTGLVGEQLTVLGYTNIDALDASPEMLTKAKEKNIYKRLLCDFMGPNKLDIENDTYDVVVSVGSFCTGHVKSDCIDELIRITKPGGHIIIPVGERYLSSVPEYQNLENEMQDIASSGKWKWITRRGLTPAEYAHEKPAVMFVFQVTYNSDQI